MHSYIPEISCLQGLIASLKGGASSPFPLLEMNLLSFKVEYLHCHAECEKVSFFAILYVKQV